MPSGHLTICVSAVLLDIPFWMQNNLYKSVGVTVCDRLAPLVSCLALFFLVTLFQTHWQVRLPQNYSVISGFTAPIL